MWHTPKMATKLNEDQGVYWEYVFDSSTTAHTSVPGFSAFDAPMYAFNLPLKNLISWKLLEAYIPFSFYVFNSTNNTFKFSESAGGPPGGQTITLPIGNYTPTEIANELTSLLTIASAANGNNFTYTVTVDPNENKLEIAQTFGSGTFTLTFGTTGDIGTTNPRLWLGFNEGANTSTGTILIAPSILQLFGPQYLFLNSKTFGVQSLFTLPQSKAVSLSGGLGVQCAMIPIGNAVPDDIIVYSDQAHSKWFNSPAKTLNTLDFYLTFGGLQADNPLPLQLNGSPFILRIGFRLGSADDSLIDSKETKKRKMQ